MEDQRRIAMVYKHVLILLLMAASLTAGVFFKKHGYDQANRQQLAELDLPDFQLPDLNGQSQSVRQLLNKVLVINFWASWCPPCLDELPDFNQVHEQYRNSGVQFLGIALDDTEAVRNVVARLAIKYPQLIAGDNGIKISQMLGNQSAAVPFTVIVDAQGRVVQRHAGIFEYSELRAVIDKHLN